MSFGDAIYIIIIRKIYNLTEGQQTYHIDFDYEVQNLTISLRKSSPPMVIFRFNNVLSSWRLMQRQPARLLFYPWYDLLNTGGLQLLTHTRPRDMARSRPPFWIFSFAAWKWINMDGNWRNFDGNISSYV